MIKQVMGIDPSLAHTAWVLLESEGRTVRYLNSHTVCPLITGRGRWAEKIRDVVIGMESAWKLGIHEVRIEKPHFGTRSKKRKQAAATAVAVQAIIDLAWQIAWHARSYTENVILCTPDNKTKAQRSQFLPGLIQNWPTRTNEHIRDAAWIALKGC